MVWPANVVLTSAYTFAFGVREARQVMEAGIAKFAVQRATPAGMHALETHLQTMRNNKGNRKKFMEASLYVDNVGQLLV